MSGSTTPTLTTIASLNTGFGTVQGALIADAQGNLFGETSDGGAYGDGSVFEINAVNSSVSTLYSFNKANSGSGNPLGGLVEDGAGNLYGTTSQQGILYKSAWNDPGTYIYN